MIIPMCEPLPSRARSRSSPCRAQSQGLGNVLITGRPAMEALGRIRRCPLLRRTSAQISVLVNSPAAAQSLRRSLRLSDDKEPPTLFPSIAVVEDWLWAWEGGLQAVQESEQGEFLTGVPAFRWCRR